MPGQGVASIQVVVQQTHADCGVCCLAMLLGRPYSDIFMHSPQQVKLARKKGLTEGSLTRLAKKVGVKLSHRRVTDDDLDEATGILFLGATKKGVDDHAVVMFNGTLIDPSDGLLWDPSVYFRRFSFVPESLFEIVS